MAVFNGEKYLEEQIRSLQAQTDGDWELVAVDDASLDGSFSILLAMAQKDERLRVFRNERNVGYVANFSKALSLATGDFMCFCDQDDRWRPKKIARLRSVLEKNKHTMLVYSDLEVCDESLRPVHGSFWRRAGIRPLAGKPGARIVLRNLAPGCSMMFRREVAALYSRLPEKKPFMHDHLALILASFLGRIDFTREKLVLYRQHGANSIGAFSGSPADRAAACRNLEEKIAFFRALPEAPIDLGRLERFAAVLRDGSVWPRPDLARYFLFLRSDRLRDQLLGWAEMLLPSVYNKLRNLQRRSS